MNRLNYQKFKKLTHNRLLCMLLLFLWLLSTSIAIAHAQQHTLTHEVDCKTCLTNANHTPIIAVTTLPFLHNPQINLVIDDSPPLATTKRCFVVCNKDPPKNFIL